MADTIDEAIEAAAISGVKRVTVDGQTVEVHDLEQQIAASQHIASQAAASRNHFGLRFTKLEPPGAG
jgi:hypothetical protein